MNKMLRLGLIAVLASLGACGQGTERSGAGDQDNSTASIDSQLVILGEDLQQLKDDFNANEGRVRLLFISGPSCGICLRGMADLNDAFLAASQNDDRLVTFVVHVPTLGAEEKHARDSIPLLKGPRILHYWEESGIIGSHYTEVMDVDMYVWDFWMIYGPEVQWEGTLPPKPGYFEHQLGAFLGDSRGFPRERVLDADRFAAETDKFLDRVDSTRYSQQPDAELSESELQADGTTIPRVAQPRNVAVRQHIIGRGGYKNLKRIQALDMRGHLEVDGQSYPLTISATRPNSIRRGIQVGDRVSIAEISEGGQAAIESSMARGIPAALESKLLETYEFDGQLVEWPDKGHELSMSGMQKIGDILAWRLDLVQANGQHWYLFIDSHGGGIVKASLLDENDLPEYSILQSDFRETSGFRYPHRIEYLDSHDQSLAVEVIDEISIEEQSFDLSGENVAH